MEASEKNRTNKRKKQDEDEDCEQEDDVLSPVKGVSKPNYDDINDINALKKALIAKDKEIELLKKKLATQEKNVQKPSIDIPFLSDTVRKSLKAQISPQIHYKPSLKGGSGRFKAEVPNCPYEVVKSVFGDDKTTTTARAKQVKFSLNSEALSKVFGTDFSKGLRYGASLDVTDCKVTFSKEGQHLKISGSYTMVK